MLPRRLQPLLGLIPLLCLSAAFAQQPPTADDILRLVKAGDVADHDFSGARAAGLTLQRVSLIGTIWRDADLRGARFSSVSLEKADLRGASLRGAIFERVSLLGADLEGADLSGGMFVLSNLENANLTGVRLDGVSFEGASVSQTGAAYLAALHAALQRASGQQFSRAWIAGLSGDAFAFSYNERNTSFWPGVPFTVNPLLAAAANLGLTATFHRGPEAEKLFFNEEPTQPQAVFVLALKLPNVDARLTQDRPLWGVLTAREVRENLHYYSFTVPPFGGREMRRDDLLKDIWGGPWETPEPAGSMFPAVRQMAKILVGVPRPTPDQARLALKQAAAIISDKRTYGPLIPGEAGLMRLAADLRATAEGFDSDKARQLVPWQSFPRNCLIGSLGLATDFLAEAGPPLPDNQQAACQEAKLILRSAMTSLDTRWPQLSAGTDKLSRDQAAAFALAADIIAEVAAAQRKAAALFVTAGG